MQVAIDIDGTLDSFPREFQSIMSALTAAGHRVWIITGVSSPSVTQQDIDEKRQYLVNLGIGPDCYSELVVCPDPTAPNKARVIEDNAIDVLVDNKKENVRAAAPHCAALLLWNSREP